MAPREPLDEYSFGWRPPPRHLIFCKMRIISWLDAKLDRTHFPPETCKDMAYIIGVLQTDLHIPLCNSLKEKRSVLRRLESHIRKKFNVSVAEIGAQDAWRSAEIGVVTGSNSRDRVHQTLHKVIDLIEREGTVQVSDYDIEIL